MRSARGSSALALCAGLILFLRAAGAGAATDDAAPSPVVGPQDIPATQEQVPPDAPAQLPAVAPLAQDETPTAATEEPPVGAPAPRQQDGAKPPTGFLTFPRTQKGQVGPMPVFPWWRLFYGMAVVLVILCVGVWIMKRLNVGATFQKGHYLEVLEAKPVGGKMQLFLVKVGRKVVLLACRGESVAAVGQFSEDEFPESEVPAKSDGPGGFKSLMQHMLKGRQ